MNLYIAEIIVFLTIPIFMIHQCQQGHRCIYYRGGSLLNDINTPGYSLKFPFITTNYDIQVTWQTDRLNNVICGSSQGGLALLDIEVVNKLSDTRDCILKVVGEHTIEYDKPLIFDYIPSEVAQFCKNYTLDDIVIREFDKLDEVLLLKLRHNVESYGLGDCLSIKNVRINRPRLDKDMQKKFESIENEKKATELAEREKETQKVRLESQLQKEIMEKERLRKTTEIEMKIDISKAHSNAEKQKIKDKMYFETKKNEAESEKNSILKKAEGYEKLLANPNYIKLETMKTAYHNSKIIIGEIPKNSIFNFDMPKTGHTSPVPFITNSTFN